MSEDMQEQSGGRQFVALDTGIGGMAFGKGEYLTPEQAARKREALHLFQIAYKAQMQGDFQEAVDLYKQSIDAYPSAEAHTFLGWTYSFLGQTDAAIEECHRAIAVDPDFGNPYNDIGAYLIEKREFDAAIPWLEQAKQAPRYEACFYPHFNLGRIYETKRMYAAALREYKAAIDLNPGYTLAARAFRKLQGTLN